jgi:hypothetical protein
LREEVGLFSFDIGSVDVELNPRVHFVAEAQSEKDVIGKNVSYNQGRTSTAMH